MKKFFLTLSILMFFVNITEAKTIDSLDSNKISLSSSAVITLDINLKKFPISKRINLSRFLIGKRFTIDWGDGAITTNRKKHRYVKRDSYTIRVYLNDVDDKIGLRGCKKSLNLALSLESIYIDNEEVEWKSLKNGFSYCGTTDITFKNPNLSSLTNLKGLFSKLYSFEGGEWLKTWDVSNITNMKKMFFLSRNFNEDISQWDVSNVTNMKKMFWYANSFNQNLAKWDVSNVTNMRKMFRKNLSTQNYSSTLVGWSNLDLQDDVTLDAYNIKYNLSGGYSKQEIIDNFGWTINDAGLYDINCTYRTAEDKCIQVEVDSTKLNLYLKHEENDIVQVEHILYPQYGARVAHIKFLPSPNGDYSLFWTSYSQMRDDLVRMVRFNSDGEEIVESRQLTMLGHMGSNPDITLLKNDNFILHWCRRGSPVLKLFDNQGDEINSFTHGSYQSHQACRRRASEPAVIIPFDDGGFNYSFGDYNNTFDSEGNPL